MFTNGWMGNGRRIQKIPIKYDAMSFYCQIVSIDMIQNYFTFNSIPVCSNYYISFKGAVLF